MGIPNPSNPARAGKWQARPSVLIAETAAFAVLVGIGLATGRMAWWAAAVGAIGFGLAVAYVRGYRPLGRSTLVVLVAMVLLLGLTACSSSVYTNDPGPSVPPTVVGMEFTHQGEDMECGIGLTQNGVAAVVTAVAPPVGFLAWGAWTVTDGDGLRATLQDCWNTSQTNWREISLTVQCWGGPTLTTTWTDWGAATAWVKIPFCQCNQACQREAWLSAAGWKWVQDFCRQWRVLGVSLCPLAGIHQAAALEPAPLTFDAPDVGEPDVPLPPGFEPPGWDPNAEAPLHPASCELVPLDPEC